MYTTLCIIPTSRGLYIIFYFLKNLTYSSTSCFVTNTFYLSKMSLWLFFLLFTRRSACVYGLLLFKYTIFFFLIHTFYECVLKSYTVWFIKCRTLLVSSMWNVLHLIQHPVYINNIILYDIPTYLIYNIRYVNLSGRVISNRKNYNFHDSTRFGTNTIPVEEIRGKRNNIYKIFINKV